MRRAGRCITKALLETNSLSSACSTSGRPAAESASLLAKRLASGSSPASRYDFYDPSRDVYREFQDKWDRANAAAKEAAAELDPDSTPAARANQAKHKLRGRQAQAEARAALAKDPAVAAAAANAAAASLPDADWPPGYETLLFDFLKGELAVGQPLTDEEASRLVEAARKGWLPGSREVIRMRFNHLKDLEPRFPGFSARAVLVGEPRLLTRSVTKLLHSMLVFQDQWPAQPVGALMPRIGHFVVTDPAAAARSLRALSRALSSDLGLSLDPLSLSPNCGFLRCPPFQLEARVEALAAIFGQEGATALLRADMGVLDHEPKVLDASVVALRQVFSASGHNHVKTYHVGTPEGAAAAAADRAYVTALAVAWPGVLTLPARLGENGVASLLANIRKAGGRRYKTGGGRRSVVLADILARPEMLRTAAEEPERLREVVAAVVAEREAAEAQAAAKVEGEEKSAAALADGVGKKGEEAKEGR